MCTAPRRNSKATPRGAAGAQFPGKLHDLMTYTEHQGLEHIISWVENGLSIMVHDPEKLLEILPHFGFGQTKYRSFQRQLNMWHWERIVDGPFKGGWRHPYFVRGNRLLCCYMSRHRVTDPSIPDEVVAACSTQVALGLSCSKRTTSPLTTSISVVSIDQMDPNQTSENQEVLLTDDMFGDDAFEPLPINFGYSLMEQPGNSPEALIWDIDPTPIREPLPIALA